MNAANLSQRDKVWDLIVIGAGPAGAFAARQAASAGLRTLLLDKQKWPRSKVCGGCLSGRAVRLLREAGLGHIVAWPHATATDTLRLACRGREAVLDLPGGVAIARDVLDPLLVDAAMDAGAAFVSAAHAEVGDCTDHGRRVTCRYAHGRETISARVVVVADGLSGSALDKLAGWEPQVMPAARMGAGALIEDAGYALEPGCVAMACGAPGYVGMVGLPDGRLDVAAALDPQAVRSAGGPGALAKTILEEAGFSRPSALSDARWRGTGRLTRRRRKVADERLFVLGDAHGYVEPFTGEGMTWALLTGDAVTAFVVESQRQWRPELAASWTRAQHRLVCWRQRWCHAVARGLRYPRLVSGAVRLLGRQPKLAQHYLQFLNSASGGTQRFVTR